VCSALTAVQAAKPLADAVRQHSSSNKDRGSVYSHEHAYLRVTTQLCLALCRTCCWVEHDNQHCSYTQGQKSKAFAPAPHLLSMSKSFASAQCPPVALQQRAQALQPLGHSASKAPLTTHWCHQQLVHRGRALQVDQVHGSIARRKQMSWVLLPWHVVLMSVSTNKRNAAMPGGCSFTCSDAKWICHTTQQQQALWCVAHLVAAVAAPKLLYGLVSTPRQL
jgi:hypothetical protein